jgi:hypothetical protein
MRHMNKPSKRRAAGLKPKAPASSVRGQESGAAATASVEGEFLFLRAPLPSAQLKDLQQWVFKSGISIRQAAIQVGIAHTIFVRAVRGIKLSWRSRRKIEDFLATLPVARTSSARPTGADSLAPRGTERVKA